DRAAEDRGSGRGGLPPLDRAPRSRRRARSREQLADPGGAAAAERRPALRRGALRARLRRGRGPRRARRPHRPHGADLVRRPAPRDRDAVPRRRPLPHHGGGIRLGGARLAGERSAPEPHEGTLGRRPDRARAGDAARRLAGAAAVRARRAARPRPPARAPRVRRRPARLIRVAPAPACVAAARGNPGAWPLPVPHLSRTCLGRVPYLTPRAPSLHPAVPGLNSVGTVTTSCRDLRNAASPAVAPHQSFGVPGPWRGAPGSGTYQAPAAPARSTLSGSRGRCSG